MCAPSVISARLFVAQPPTISTTQRNAVTARPVRTAPSSRTWSRGCIAGSGPVVRDEREHLGALEPPAAAEERELDHERARDDPAAAATDELDGRRSRSARREQVVEHEHAVTMADGVVVNLERVAAVLEIVARGVLLPRELPRLPH